MKKKPFVQTHKTKVTMQSQSMHNIDVQNNSYLANSTPRKSLSISQNILNLTITSPPKNDIPSKLKTQGQSSLQDLLFDKDCSIEMLLIEDNIDNLMTNTFQSSLKHSNFNCLDDLLQGSFQEIAQQQQQSQISEQMLLSRQIHQNQSQIQYEFNNSLKKIIFQTQSTAKFECYTNKNRTIILNNDFNKLKSGKQDLKQQLLLKRLLHHLKSKNSSDEYQFGSFCKYLLTQDESLQECIKCYLLFKGINYTYSQFQSLSKKAFSKLQTKRKIKEYFLQNFMIKSSKNQNLLINKSYQVLNIWDLLIKSDPQTFQLICEWLILN